MAIKIHISAPFEDLSDSDKSNGNVICWENGYVEFVVENKTPVGCHIDTLKCIVSAYNKMSLLKENI